MNLHNIYYSNLNINNLDEVINFIKKEKFNIKIKSSYLKWWYLDKKFSDFTFLFSKYDKEIISIATINNFNFKINDEIVKFGMPQNVITAKKFRGKGLFRNVFNECERISINKNVKNYITFTNSKSTSIFLEFFKYSKGLCPNIILLPVFSFSRKIKNISRVYNFDKNFFHNHIFKVDNFSIVKNKEYFLWRYENDNMKDLHILELRNSNIIKGYIIFRYSYKKNIKICYLLDTIGLISKENLNEFKKYINKDNCYIIILLENDSYEKIFNLKFKIRLKNKFNFLVKSFNKDNNFLSFKNFNLTFGDLDFINYI